MGDPASTPTGAAKGSTTTCDVISGEWALGGRGGGGEGAMEVTRHGRGVDGERGRGGGMGLSSRVCG